MADSENTRDFGTARDIVVRETSLLLGLLVPDEWDAAAALIAEAKATFLIGNGRSGLAARMAAMRLMHLGLDVHVAGEATAPAVSEGDVVIAVSGSGSTRSVVAAADIAIEVGAAVVAVTTAPHSLLADRATRSLIVPAVDKQHFGNTISSQYAGSLFEQGVVLGFDALFHSMWRSNTQSAETLWSRHANIG